MLKWSMWVMRMGFPLSAQSTTPRAIGGAVAYSSTRAKGCITIRRSLSKEAEMENNHTLVVVVRGWTTTGDPLMGKRPGSEIRQEFKQALMGEMPGAEVWAPELEMSMFSMRHPESLAR